MLSIKHSSDGKIIVLIAYVDDIILIGHNFEEMEKIKRLMAIEFEIKDLRTLRYILGMEVVRNQNDISISHQICQKRQACSTTNQQRILLNKEAKKKKKND